MQDKLKLAHGVVEALEARYPDAACALHWEGDPWRLLVMGRLSAQCTDARVNVVCRDLFARFPTCSAMADAPVEEIEELIKSCGLFRGKARNIKDASIMLRNEFGGELPREMDLRTAGLLPRDPQGSREGGEDPGEDPASRKAVRLLPPHCAVRTGCVHGPLTPVRGMRAAGDVCAL